MRGYCLEEVETTKLKVFKVSVSNRLLLGTSSKGNQIKWYKDGCYIKLDLLGYESIAEVCVSHLLSWSNLKEGMDWVFYSQCLIVEDGKALGLGCYCKDYKREGTLDISASKLLQKKGVSFGIGYYEFIDFIDDFIGLNCKVYLDKILCLDSITRNEDRHFGNINFLFDFTTNEYSLAPIYDNGSSCLSDLVSYPMSEEFSVNYNSVLAKPFSIRFEDQIHNVIRLLIDEKGYFNSIGDIKDANILRALRVIETGLKNLKGVSWEVI